MHIGLDFDNTIVCYDRLFYQAALDLNLIPAALDANKLAVRDFLRAAGNEDAWTELQGTVYGLRMPEADPYPGVVAFLILARDRGHKISIISHKTRHPYLGPPYDLHQAATEWIRACLAIGGRRLVEAENIYFELTKAEKIARIAAARCDAFVDDLPEIFSAPDFPGQARRIFFDPDRRHITPAEWTGMAAWADLPGILGL